MATRTLAQLRTEARQRADMETDDSFIADSELTRMINQSIKELRDLLIENQGHEFFLTTQVITTVAGTSSYALNSAFYQLLGVDVTVGGSVYTALPFNFHERNSFLNSSGWGNCPVYYRIEGSNIVFIPTPGGAHTVTLWYIPQFTDLSSDSDTFDGISGWEEYVVVDAAMKMLEKEESDTSALMARKMVLVDRIRSLAAKRDAGMPARIVDVYPYYPYWYSEA